MIKKFKYRDITWIDLDTPNQAEINTISQDYNIHTIVAQELLQPSRRSHLDLYEEFIYLILQFPTCQICYGETKTGLPELDEVDFIMGKEFLITTHYGPVAAIDEFAKIFAADIATEKARPQMHAGFLFFYIIRALYAGLTEGLEYINDNLKQVEREIFAGREKPMVVTLAAINRNLLDFRWALKTHREILTALETAGREFFGDKFGYTLRSVVGEYGKIWSMVESNRETYLDLQAINDSLLSTKTNETMKVLTVLAFLFLPISLIANIFNMNISLPLSHGPYDFPIIIGVMIIITIITFMIAKQKKWL